MEPTTTTISSSLQWNQIFKLINLFLSIITAFRSYRELANGNLDSLKWWCAIGTSRTLTLHVLETVLHMKLFDPSYVFQCWEPVVRFIQVLTHFLTNYLRVILFSSLGTQKKLSGIQKYRFATILSKTIDDLLDEENRRYATTVTQTSPGLSARKIIPLRFIQRRDSSLSISSTSSSEDQSVNKSDSENDYNQ